MRSKSVRSLRSALLFLLAFVLTWRFCGGSLGLLWERRSHLGDVFARMFPPDLSYAAKVLAPLLTTLRMSVAGTALGALLALLAAPFLARDMAGTGWLRIPCRILIQILRSFPPLILALTATFLFGLGAFAGTVAITVYTFAIMTRLTYEDMENAPQQACRALKAMGVRPLAAAYQAVFPRIRSSYLTNVLYLLETNVRHSAILGYVGAGGIGLLLNEKISWQEYDRVGTILLAFFLAVCLIELISTYLTALVTGQRHIGKWSARILLCLLGLLLLWSLTLLQETDWSRTSLHTVRSILKGLVMPDWSLALDFGKSGLAWMLFETVCIAFAGTTLGALLSLPLAILGSGRLMPRPVAGLFRLVVIAIRSIPFLIYGIIFIRVTGPGAFAGVLTLSCCSIGLLSKRYAQAIDTVDFRAYRALRAMGTPALSSLRHALLPQLLPAIWSATLYRFDVNIREASVLGIVGAGGIGAPLVFAMNHYNWSASGMILLGLIVLVWLIDLLSARSRADNSSVRTAKFTMRIRKDKAAASS